MKKIIVLLIMLSLCFGLASCGVDWKQQAALKAQDYLDTMSFSREELLDQLESEGFTSEQAEYGVSAVGY